MLLALLLAGLNSIHAATPRLPDGKRIYQKQCASCHGAKGEGVKDKYADPLAGDWSVAKLARYVGANMPEDKPETLSAPEAEAVSRYVYDAFYSRTAQARINPVRVELAHLTNQQYAITLAELLRGSVHPTTRPPQEADSARSITAQRSADVSTRRRSCIAAWIETVDFVFEEGSPLREKLGPLTDFSMQWRGAVLADETGDYEFIVRTPTAFAFGSTRTSRPRSQRTLRST
jgi:hypothetical protein